jgi:hypothetical protein
MWMYGGDGAFWKWMEPSRSVADYLVSRLLREREASCYVRQLFCVISRFWRAAEDAISAPKVYVGISTK